MAEQLTDTVLRALVAQWIRAALGELEEDESRDEEDEQSILASLHSFSAKVETEVTPKGQSAPRARGKEESYAYPGGGG